MTARFGANRAIFRVPTCSNFTAVLRNTWDTGSLVVLEMEIEPGEEEGQQAPGPADPAQSLGKGGAAQTNSPSATMEVENKASEHDSLVTVRLSEPPSLSLNTALPPSSIPPRSSPAVPDCAPSDAMAETLEEEEDDDSESEIFEPETSASKRGPNLQQELGRLDTGRPDEDDDDVRGAESWSSAGSERVDWERLQQKEDLESKKADNVGSRQS